MVLMSKLVKRITETAEKKGQSLNKTIKELLEKALGLTPQRSKDYRNDFSEFLGVPGLKKIVRNLKRQLKTLRKLIRGIGYEKSASRYKRLQ